MEEVKVTMKCGKCKQEKQEVEFNWRNRGMGRRDRWCKECRQAYDRETRMARYWVNRHKHIASASNRAYGGNVTEVQLKECLEFFGNKDAYTGEQFRQEGANEQIFAHIMPINKGGENEIWNTVPTTWATNGKKSRVKDLAEWFELIPPNQAELVLKWMATAQIRYAKQ